MQPVRRLLKRAESVLQRELIRAASLPARRRYRPPAEPPRRILVVRNDWIGDMVMSTGCFRRLKEAYPEADVDVIASPANDIVLDGLPFVRKRFVHRQGDLRGLRRLRRQLRAERYDVALNGRVLRPKLTPDPALLLLASGAPRRIGPAGGGSDFVYTDAVPPPVEAHVVEHVASLTRPLGLDPERGDWRPVLHVFQREREAAERRWAEVPGSGPKLLVNMSSRDPRRRWPLERYVAALRQLRSAAPDLRVLVISPPDESGSARTVAGQLGAPAATPGLRDSFALAASADLVFTPNTSIVHAASAFAIPVVMLTISAWAGFGPYRTPGRYLCPRSPTLAGLELEPVVEALEFVYKRRLELEPECLPFKRGDAQVIVGPGTSPQIDGHAAAHG
jgi:ADP-heptose:LPS heptosyltransferase